MIEIIFLLGRTYCLNLTPHRTAMQRLEKGTYFFSKCGHGLGLPWSWWRGKDWWSEPATYLPSLSHPDLPESKDASSKWGSCKLVVISRRVVHLPFTNRFMRFNHLTVIRCGGACPTFTISAVAKVLAAPPCRRWQTLKFLSIFFSPMPRCCEASKWPKPIATG